MYTRLLEAPTMSAVRALEELRHGLVSTSGLLLVVRDFGRLALAAGVHGFRVVDADRLVHAIPILSLPV